MSLNDWFRAHPTISWAIMCVSALGFVLSIRHLKNVMSGIRYRRTLAWDGESTPLNRDLLEEGLQHAKEHGYEKAFLAALTECRRLYGDEGLRLGHFNWIIKRVIGDIPPGSAPPSFVPDEKK